MSKFSREAVLKVVVFHGSVALHVGEAAVVVGEQQAFGRDQFAGAAAAELHDGIFEAGLVEAENLFCRQFAAQTLHVGEVLSINGVGEPHPLIGAHTGNKHHQKDE